ncbi:LacI family DNA-binding transcriptional regulator [Sphingomonas sabuli]|uniref:LacI family DNA-binding transcriptional regulator n=2 Tax=Sphingomonas sabuli TaxID=2764186 RepID=A0A7G9L5X0_9SPHN|nr:LacI family DNA-binding transcriptional regulator [Sphingomonas sabuli]
MSGVSRQTVSRVLNDHPNVRDEVRERVRSAISSLGYAPNLAARRMGGAKSYLIMAINDRQRTLENWEAERGNDWVDQMLRGGMLACEANGYHMLFELIDTDERAVTRLSEILSSLRPDGIVLTPPHSENSDLWELLESRNCPFVVLNTPVHDDMLQAGMDERAAAVSATRHLTDLGHRRIAFLSGRRDYGNTSLRVDGFLSEVERVGGETLVELADFSFDTAARVTTEWLESGAPPSAIIAENDEMAFAVLHVANLLDIKVPEQLSVMSFEDTPGVRFSVPPLTAIRQPTAAIVACACDMLMTVAEGKTVEPHHVLPFELIVRDSTARYAAA